MTTFPLSVSTDGRYLVDAAGLPFRVQGDGAWEICNELSLSDVQQYLDDRNTRGVNAIIVQVSNTVRYVAASVAPSARGASFAMPFLNTSGGTWNGDPTFRDNILNNVPLGSATGNFDADFSKPVDAYWDWVDTVINEALTRNIVLIADFMYMGFNQGSNDGWWRTINNTQNTQSVCLGFGTYLGNRWKNHHNLIISLGTDMFPVSGSENSARFKKIIQGMQTAGCTQPVLAHYQRSADSQDYSDYNSLITVNGVYPGTSNSGTFAPDIARIRNAYTRSAVQPVFSVESNYEPDRTRTQLRYLAWGGHLSGTAGYSGFANDTIWTFDTGWQAQLGSNGSLDMQTMGAFFNTISWYQLIPNGLGTIGTLITSGTGTVQTLGSPPGTHDATDGLDYICAAATPNGSYLVAYIPEGHSGAFSVDMTKLRSLITAVWFDPSNGAKTAIGTFSNVGTHSFTIPGANAAGANDWVLLLSSNILSPTSFFQMSMSLS